MPKLIRCRHHGSLLRWSFRSLLLAVMVGTPGLSARGELRPEGSIGIDSIEQQQSQTAKRLKTTTKALCRLQRVGILPLLGNIDALRLHYTNLRRLRRVAHQQLTSLQHLDAEVKRLRANNPQPLPALSGIDALDLQRLQQADLPTMTPSSIDVLDSSSEDLGVLSSSNGELRTAQGTLRIIDEVNSPQQTHRDVETAIDVGQLAMPLTAASEVRDAKRGGQSGLEFLTERSAKVRAAEEGRVVFSGNDPVLGRMVILDHGKSLYSVYANLAEVNVSVGDMLSRGASLGSVGSGSTASALLFFQVRRGTRSLDARAWLGL